MQDGSLYFGGTCKYHNRDCQRVWHRSAGDWQGGRQRAKGGGDQDQIRRSSVQHLRLHIIRLPDQLHWSGSFHLFRFYLVGVRPWLVVSVTSSRFSVWHNFVVFG